MATMQVQQVQPLPNPGQCPECGSRMFATNPEGFTVCVNCGVVDELPPFKEDKLETWGQGYLVNRNTWALPVRNNTDGQGRKLSAIQQAKYTYLHFRDLQFRDYGRDPGIHCLNRLRGILWQLPLTLPVRDMALNFASRILKTQVVLNAVTMLAACVLQAARKTAPGGLTLQQCIQMFAANGHRVNTHLVRKAWEEYRAVLGISPAINPSHYLERVMAGVASIDGLWTRVQSKTDHLIPGPYASLAEYLTMLRTEVWKVFKAIPPSGIHPLNMMVAITFCADKTLAAAGGYPSILTQALMEHATGVKSYSIRDIYVNRLKPESRTQLCPCGHQTRGHRKTNGSETVENNELETEHNHVEEKGPGTPPPKRTIDPKRRERVFQHLQLRSDGQTVRQVKEVLHLNMCTTQYHLTNLLKSGQVTREKRGVGAAVSYLTLAFLKTLGENPIIQHGDPGAKPANNTLNVQWGDAQ